MSEAPPPPPHGEAPKTAEGGLPPGKFDIFIIPEHSAGCGFLYLPSLRPNPNSFVAGFASALLLIVLAQSMAPAFQTWWANFQGMGNMGMAMLVIAVGLGAWSLGRVQQDGPGGQGGQGGNGMGGGRHHNPASGFGGTSPPGGTNAGPSPHSPPPHSPPPPPQPETPHSEKPKPSWQRPPQPGTTRPETSKGTWEKAREETRRKEEERKAQEAERIKKEAAAQRLKELREKEARERAQREKERLEKEARDREEKEQKERELRERHEREQRDREQREQKQHEWEQREREQREREEREREKHEKEKREREQREREREQREREEREREQRERQQREREQRAKELREKLEREKAERDRLKKEKEEQERLSRKGSTYAYSSVGERTNPWPNGKPPAAASSQPAPPSAAAKAAPSESPSSPSKKPPAPTAKSDLGTDEDAYSFRPYDKPKRPARKKSISDMSETSWAPSQSTARTTPPPSVRAPYTTKDPDKIVIHAVYGYLNQFAKTPSSQLISGVGSVTDGLILRVTTEGLFIDDDVRGVAQREWDVKAWTLKMVEVWCPAHSAALANSGNPIKPSGANLNNASFLHKTTWRSSMTAGRGGEPRPLTDVSADAYLADMLDVCKGTCRLGRCDSASATASSAASPVSSATGTNKSASAKQTGEWRTKGLHLLRATVRDQEGKRYLFVLGQEEAWKVAVGLQRLRKGTQVRSLGVVGMTSLEVKTVLETLGWGG